MKKWKKYKSDAELVLNPIDFKRLSFQEESPEKPFMINIDTHGMRTPQAEGLVKHCMDIAPYGEKVIVRVIHGYNRGTNQKNAFLRFYHPFARSKFFCPWNKGTTYFEVLNFPK